jgi:hypothetical protein
MTTLYTEGRFYRDPAVMMGAAMLPQILLKAMGFVCLFRRTLVPRCYQRDAPGLLQADGIL